MTEVVSVKFKDSGKNYFFSPDGREYKVGSNVIVETANGLAFGTVTESNHEVPSERIVPPIKKVLRVANERDMQRLKENEEKQNSALKVCEQKVLDHKLDMKLVSAEYSFDGGKITFFFTADGRVDFRELVKDLANHFHSRIELRQIGVRDEAKMLGGIGICGQEYCCKRFLDDFLPVSIKMAKEQSLSLNPTKISGSCGRLMCCLNYEQNSYEYLNSITPSIGTTVKTEQGVGIVTDVNFITGDMTVRPKDDDGIPYKTNRKYVKVLHGNRPKKQDDK